MKKSNFVVRPIKASEINEVSELLAVGYDGDVFFEWCVPKEKGRHKVIADYYKIYLGAIGCIAHVAEDSTGRIVGASVWLPHDTDESIYPEIERVVGENAPMFRAVAHDSHLSEPPMEPFYQLVGFGVLKELRGLGIGCDLLKYHLDILDEKGISTYLEASTPYFGSGVYSKFDYQPVGELMKFTEEAVLYPLWRHARKPDRKFARKVDAIESSRKSVINFGGISWLVLDGDEEKLLLLAENVLCLKKYNDKFEETTWEGSSIRKYLNEEFLERFSSEEKSRILESVIKNNGNIGCTWYDSEDIEDTTDKVFLLSVSEVVKYLGDGGKFKIKDKNASFFIDDGFNESRIGKYIDGSPSRWYLRTAGNFPDLVATVTVDGKVSLTGDFVNRESSKLFKVGVRPAMWVSQHDA